jgi:hypothetical protein
VDPQYYKIIDKSTTSFIGTNTAALSSVTATESNGATTVTAARVGIYTGTSDGQTEYSVFVCPDLLEQMEAVLSQPNSTSKRDLENRDVMTPIFAALTKLLGPDLALSLGLKALQGGIGAVAGMAVEFGPLLIAGFAILFWVASGWLEMVKDLHRNYPGGVPISVKVPISEFRDIRQCPSTVDCSTCSGKNFMCTKGNYNKCKINYSCIFFGLLIIGPGPCQDIPSGCLLSPDDQPICVDVGCLGTSQGVCTVETQKDCPCIQLSLTFQDPIPSDLDQLQSVQQLIYDYVGIPHKPAGFSN